MLRYFLLLSLAFTYSYSQSPDPGEYRAFLNEYTSNAPGDTVELYARDEQSDGYLYMFTEESSCYSCLMSLGPFYESLNEIFQVPAILFVDGAADFFAEHIKRENRWKFQVLADKTGECRKVYKVHQAPFYLLLDKRGRILLMDKIGGSRVGMKDLIEALGNAKSRGESSPESE